MNQENVRVKPKDAAKEIGCAVGYLRERMRKGDWDLGSVVKPKTKGGRCTYHIFRPKLDLFIGKQTSN